MTDKNFIVGAILYPGYDLLDFNGPISFLRILKKYELDIKIITISQHGGNVESESQCSNLSNYSFDECPNFNVLLVPGGIGTRKEIDNSVLINFIDKWIPKVEYVLTVCTGSSLIAKTGHLDGKKATSNKRAFKWVTSHGPKVNWIKHARWVVDGKFYTSAGGMDMVLGWISDVFGEKYAKDAALHAEYEWHSDPSWDPFSEMELDSSDKYVVVS
ncbi:1811_t:CDS:2 [Gigaspora margarita]|uniref:1811_t:CDS:1 n=1 Tax=Gigaspora margarita TaxID=4874 RepID=A0ABN7UKA4_GIGMA|nr:1811_t:CDS:2 [Gigaspora margarita]